MIIVYLIYDEASLLACSLTCYSWYIASIPHLHHTLVTSFYWRVHGSKHMWPKSVRNMDKFSLLPLVKKFQVREGAHLYHCASPQTRFNYRTLYHFWTLTNVQELGIEYLDIPSVMPKIRRYFRHFLPTVRSLSLRAPKGSNRHIMCFIGMFQHLEDLKIIYGIFERQGEAKSATLIPPLIPPLRGRLKVVGLRGVGLLKEMIEQFGGIRFHYMDIYEVEGMRLMLGACGNALETLRLYPFSKELSLKIARVLADNFIVGFLDHFNLSRNKSLRTLEVNAWSIRGDPRLLIYALSTITSPAFSKVIVFYQGVAEVEGTSAWHRHRFEAFRAMRGVRDFQLVLCAHVPDDVGERSVRKLKQVVAAEKAQMGSDYIFPEPLVFYLAAHASSPTDLTVEAPRSQ
jgi:hypothetical protein